MRSIFLLSILLWLLFLGSSQATDVVVGLSGQSSHSSFIPSPQDKVTLRTPRSLVLFPKAMGIIIKKYAFIPLNNIITYPQIAHNMKFLLSLEAFKQGDWVEEYKQSVNEALKEQGEGFILERLGWYDKEHKEIDLKRWLKSYEFKGPRTHIGMEGFWVDWVVKKVWKEEENDPHLHYKRLKEEQKNYLKDVHLLAPQEQLLALLLQEATEKNRQMEKELEFLRPCMRKLVQKIQQRNREQSEWKKRAIVLAQEKKVLEQQIKKQSEWQEALSKLSVSYSILFLQSAFYLAIIDKLCGEVKSWQKRCQQKVHQRMEQEKELQELRSKVNLFERVKKKTMSIQLNYIKTIKRLNQENHNLRKQAKERSNERYRTNQKASQRIRMLHKQHLQQSQKHQNALLRVLDQLKTLNDRKDKVEALLLVLQKENKELKEHMSSTPSLSEQHQDTTFLSNCLWEQKKVNYQLKEQIEMEKKGEEALADELLEMLEKNNELETKNKQLKNEEETLNSQNVNLQKEKKALLQQLNDMQEALQKVQKELKEQQEIGRTSKEQLELQIDLIEYQKNELYKEYELLKKKQEENKEQEHLRQKEEKPEEQQDHCIETRSVHEMDVCSSIKKKHVLSLGNISSLPKHLTYDREEQPLKYHIEKFKGQYSSENLQEQKVTLSDLKEVLRFMEKLPCHPSGAKQYLYYYTHYKEAFVHWLEEIKKSEEKDLSTLASLKWVLQLGKSLTESFSSVDSHNKEECKECHSWKILYLDKAGQAKHYKERWQQFSSTLKVLTQADDLSRSKNKQWGNMQEETTRQLLEQVDKLEEQKKNKEKQVRSLRLDLYLRTNQKEKELLTSQQENAQTSQKLTTAVRYWKACRTLFFLVLCLGLYTVVVWEAIPLPTAFSF